MPELSAFRACILKYGVVLRLDNFSSPQRRNVREEFDFSLSAETAEREKTASRA
jgi:hypothetical protein